MSKQTKKQSDQQETEPKVYGDPVYAAKDDIYSQSEEVEFDDSDENAEKIPEGDEILKKAQDLDVPGSELDDDDEKTGEEDEENNYYSLGGDNHNDLEEDDGE